MAHKIRKEQMCLKMEGITLVQRSLSEKTVVILAGKFLNKSLLEVGNAILAFS